MAGTLGARGGNLSAIGNAVNTNKQLQQRALEHFTSLIQRDKENKQQVTLERERVSASAANAKAGRQAQQQQFNVSRQDRLAQYQQGRDDDVEQLFMGLAQRGINPEDRSTAGVAKAVQAQQIQQREQSQSDTLATEQRRRDMTLENFSREIAASQGIAISPDASIQEIAAARRRVDEERQQEAEDRERAVALDREITKLKDQLRPAGADVSGVIDRRREELGGEISLAETRRVLDAEQSRVHAEERQKVEDKEAEAHQRRADEKQDALEEKRLERARQTKQALAMRKIEQLDDVVNNNDLPLETRKEAQRGLAALEQFAKEISFASDPTSVIQPDTKEMYQNFLDLADSSTAKTRAKNDRFQAEGTIIANVEAAQNPTSPGGESITAEERAYLAAKTKAMSDLHGPDYSPYLDDFLEQIAAQEPTEEATDGVIPLDGDPVLATDLGLTSGAFDDIDFRGATASELEVVAGADKVMRDTSWWERSPGVSGVLVGNAMSELSRVRQSLGKGLPSKLLEKQHDALTRIFDTLKASPDVLRSHKIQWLHSNGSEATFFMSNPSEAEKAVLDAMSDLRGMGIDLLE